MLVFMPHNLVEILRFFTSDNRYVSLLAPDNVHRLPKLKQKSGKVSGKSLRCCVKMSLLRAITLQYSLHECPAGFCRRSKDPTRNIFVEAVAELLAIMKYPFAFKPKICHTFFSVLNLCSMPKRKPVEKLVYLQPVLLTAEFRLRDLCSVSIPFTVIVVTALRQIPAHKCGKVYNVYLVYILYAVDSLYRWKIEPNL